MKKFNKIFKSIVALERERKILKAQKLKMRELSSNPEQLMHRSGIIDIERLEVWPTLSAFAKEYHCSVPYVTESIALARRAKGRLLEYFDEWIVWDNACKEQYTRDRGIYFY